MGSVPDLYTTGDNDPEIFPVQYYRHYLYCDACGSFELDSWMAPDKGFLGSKIELVGMRCKQCDATYAHGTPFFTDLDANPRHLTVADVPRPLGVSPFSRGKSVDYEPPDPPSRLPP